MSQIEEIIMLSIWTNHTETIYINFMQIEKRRTI